MGVVVSYYGIHGTNTTGSTFRYGEQVSVGEKGVWRQALAPGKYPLNPYAIKVNLFPGYILYCAGSPAKAKATNTMNNLPRPKS